MLASCPQPLCSQEWDTSLNNVTLISSSTEMQQTNMGVSKHGLFLESLILDDPIANSILPLEEACDINGASIVSEEFNADKFWRMVISEETLAPLEDTLPLPSFHDITYILQKCQKSKDNSCVFLVHAYMCKTGLDEHHLFGSLLFSMMVEVGCMNLAEQVFYKLTYQDQNSWDSLIIGFINHGEPHRALMLYRELHCEGSVHLSVYSLVALIKACGKLKKAEQGIEIHDHISQNGSLDRDPFVGSSLMDMYAKCGLLMKACKVFKNLSRRDVVPWTTLIAGYTEHGHGKKALDCYEQMKLDGVCPNGATLVCALKACGSLTALDKGLEVHAEVARQGLEKDLFIGSTLVDMYGKCGVLDKAQEIFDKLPIKDAVSWTALIGAYAKHGRGLEALNCLEQMKQSEVYPSAGTFVCVLNACSIMEDDVKGQELHTEITKRGFERELLVGNALVDLYGRCGLLSESQVVFDKLVSRDVVSWNTLITRLVEQDCNEEALECFQLMQDEGIHPNAITYVGILKVCGNLGALTMGEEIHEEILAKGLLQNNDILGNALVDMYAKCGAVFKAQEVFDRLRMRSVVPWTSLITGYAEHGYPKEALNSYKRMRVEGVIPNAITYVCILKACGTVRAIRIGQEIHAEVVRTGVVPRNLIVGNALIDMYAKCGLMTKAQEVFDNLVDHDVVSWTTLIAGYADKGSGHEALEWFDRMLVEGFSPNAVTFISALKSCGSMGLEDLGEEIQAQIVCAGLLEMELNLGNTLIDMYMKLGLLARAENVFNDLPVRDVVSWSALIAGYAEHENGEKALACLNGMRDDKLSPNSVTFVFGLKACGSLGNLTTGQELHAEIATSELEGDLLVRSSLVDMYAKLGWLSKAQELFNGLLVRDVCVWNALIAGYSQLGIMDLVFFMFEELMRDGHGPNVTTFLSVLNACNHAGLIDEGQAYFEAMNTDHGLILGLEHYACMIDLFCRAGQLANAAALIKEMPIRCNAVVWHVFLRACQKVGGVELGREVFEHVIRMNEDDAGSYVCMSNVYANDED